MKIVIKSTFKDTLAFILHLNKRRRVFRRTAPGRLTPGAMNTLAQELHPQKQILRITNVRSETPTSRTFTLVPNENSGKVALFRGFMQ